MRSEMKGVPQVEKLLMVGPGAPLKPGVPCKYGFEVF